MNRRVELEERRDQRLRDLLELEVRMAAGELSAEEAERLRRRDERAALAAIGALEELDQAEEASPGPRRPPGARPRRWLLAGGAVAVTTAVAVSLAGAITDRPVGGFITGNELSATGEMPPTRDDVPIEALEEVVAANPDVTAMRLTLADRLFAEGRYPEAGEQYLEVLQGGQQPQPRVLARLAWLAAGDGNLEVAIQMADAALQLAPGDAEARWVRADLARAAGDDGLARRLFRQLAEDPSLDAASRDGVEAALRELGEPSDVTP